jgi:hypothetical protein
MPTRFYFQGAELVLVCRYEMLVRCCWAPVQTKAMTRLQLTCEALTCELMAAGLHRAQQLGCPLQHAHRDARSMHMQQLMGLVRAAVPGGDSPRVPWVLLLSALLSAAAAGESLRPAKTGANAEHRCQVQNWRRSLAQHDCHSLAKLRALRRCTQPSTCNTQLTWRTQ